MSDAARGIQLIETAIGAAERADLPDIIGGLERLKATAYAAMTAPPAQTSYEDLTLPEAAAELKVHPKTAYAWAVRRLDPLPTVGYGRARRVPRRPFQAWRKRQSEAAR